MCYGFSALDGFKPGGNSSAGTIFALLLIFTVPAGAIFGAALGDNYGRTGELALGTPDPIEAFGGPTTESGLARSLCLDRVKTFEAQVASFSEEEQRLAQVKFLCEAVGDYRKLMRQRLKWIVLATLASLSIYPLVLAALYLAARALIEGEQMGSRLTTLVGRWSVDLHRELPKLPMTLRSFAA
ncbi:MAG: hypothetical protein CMJ58_08170 [Planctomycetaceae bacterium]|nr:hypothetical protein [Planctomycetaceae bacterium]